MNMQKNDSLMDLKASYLQVTEDRQRKRVSDLESIEDYQKLEEIAKNFDYLQLKPLLLKNDYFSEKIVKIEYETSYPRQKILYGFDTLAFFWNDLLFYSIHFGWLFKAQTLLKLNLFPNISHTNTYSGLFFRIYDHRKIKLPELRLLFMELKELGFQPYLSIFIYDGKDVSITITVEPLKS